uniref:Uncharacterized protein n=1 Tax=Fagus sylvatica TaxID=28930 RepID=A0A2N9HHW7_FAGSY
MAAKACHGQGMGCPRHAKAMPWLPRLATAKAWAAKAKAWAAKACHGLRHVPRLPRHGLPMAKACAAKAMPWLPRLATAKAWAAQGQGMCCQGNAMAAKACHGQGMGCPCQGMCCQGYAMAAKACHGQGMGQAHAARHVLLKGTPWFVSQEHSISLQQSHTNNTQFEQSNPIGWIPLDL